MTKKVLISLEDIIALRRKCLQEMCNSEAKAGVCTLSLECEDWFDSQPAAPQWVRVDDCLPKDDESVFIALEEKWLGGDGVISVFRSKKIGQYHEKENNWSISDYGTQGDINVVTHWMPIPELPEED